MLQYLAILLKYSKSADPKRITLWRYEDPIIGPRKIPTCDNLERGKVELKETQTFAVNIENQTVTINENGSHIEIGSRIVYMVS